MLNLRTGKAFTRRESIKGLAAILAAGCAPSIAKAAARGAGGMARMRGAAAAATAAAAAYDYYDGVEYLESSGTQKIDLNIAWDNDYNQIVKFNPTQSGGSVIGLSTGLWTYSVYFYTGTLIAWYLTNGMWYWENPTYGENHTVEVSFSGMKVDGTDITRRNDSNPSPSGTMNLFYGKGGYCSAQVSEYSLRSLSTSKEIIHFVPVLHEGEGKMLDLCHNKLYSNAGTGSFIVGPRTGVIAVLKQGFGANTPSI